MPRLNGVSLRVKTDRNNGDGQSPANSSSENMEPGLEIRVDRLSARCVRLTGSVELLPPQVEQQDCRE